MFCFFLYFVYRLLARPKQEGGVKSVGGAWALASTGTRKVDAWTLLPGGISTSIQEAKSLSVGGERSCAGIVCLSLQLLYDWYVCLVCIVYAV